MHYKIQDPDTGFRLFAFVKVFTLSLFTRALNLRFKVIIHRERNTSYTWNVR